MKRVLVRPQAVLVFVVLLWASTFVVTKYVLTQHIPPLVYIGLRYLLGTIVMISLRPFVDNANGRRPSLFQGLLKEAIVLGILQAFALIFQVVGQLYTTASKSSFLTAFSIPLVPLLGWAFYREIPKKMQLLAILVGAFGLLLLTYPEHGFYFNAGDLLTLCCAIIYGIVIIQTARWSNMSDAFRLATGQTVVASGILLLFWGLIFLLPSSNALSFLVLSKYETWHFSLGFLAALLYMSIVCIALSFSLQLWAMAQMKATQAAVIFALEPVFTTGIALVVFGWVEFPKIRGMLGAAMILSAIFLSELAFNKKPEKTKS